MALLRTPVQLCLAAHAHDRYSWRTPVITGGRGVEPSSGVETTRPYHSSEGTNVHCKVNPIFVDYNTTRGLQYNRRQHDRRLNRNNPPVGESLLLLLSVLQNTQDKEGLFPPG